MVEDNDLKFLGQKALLAYLKSVYLQSDKDVFDLSAIDVHQLALAMGLPSAPKLTMKVNQRGLKDKNVPYQLRDILAEGKGEGGAKKKSKEQKAASGEERGMKEMDKLLKRKSQGPLSEQRMKMAAAQAADDVDDDEDDVLVIKKRHTVEDDEEEDEKEDAEGGLVGERERHRDRPILAQQQQEEDDDENNNGGSWIEEAVQQLASQDVTDKQRERDRIHQKHQARRMKDKVRQQQDEGQHTASLPASPPAIRRTSIQLAAHTRTQPSHTA